jgi:hypothetical protein
MEYSVLSPRGEVDPIKTIGLNPRLKTLKGKTIGLYTTFKGHWVVILDEIGKQLKQKYPDIKFTSFRYPKDLNAHNQIAELAKDPEYLPKFKKWIAGVDAVIVANADAGSCTLYLTYNAALPELLGKPTVLTVKNEYIQLAKSSASFRGVPGLRLVEFNIGDLSSEPSMDDFIKVIIPQTVTEKLDEIIDALTRPLTAEEQTPKVKTGKYPRIVCKGNLPK